MKNLMIVAASLMIVANAQAEQQFEISVEITPVVAEKQTAAAKSDERFGDYALENAAAGGQ
jgi:hypothetical protein